MRTGRPPEKPDPKICDEIIAWLEDGRTLREFCRQKGKPSFSSVYRWIEKDEDFAERFARARDVGQDLIAEGTLELIDAEPQRIVTDGGNGRIDPGWVQNQRNRVEQRMKLLMVWNPRKYGNKVDVTSAGKGLNITIDMGTDDQRTFNDRSVEQLESAGGTIK